MPYATYSDEQRVPVTMVEDLIPTDYAPSIARKIRQDHVPPSYSPETFQHFSPEMFAAMPARAAAAPVPASPLSMVEELRQIKYILIAIGVILMIIILLLTRAR